MKVAIARMAEAVAPCFECSATVVIFTIEGGRIIEQIEFRLRSEEPLDRVRLLRDQKVDTLICGGVQDVVEDVVKASGIQVVSWVSGNIEDLLGLFIQGRLVSGSRTEQPAPGDRPHTRRKGNSTQ